MSNNESEQKPAKAKSKARAKAKSKSKPRAKAKPKKPKESFTLRLDEDLRKDAEALAGRLGCTVGEIFRRALPLFVMHLEAAAAGSPREVSMRGDDATLRWKRQALEIAAEGQGPTRCAYEVGVTPATVRYHLDTDPLFKQLFDEARHLCVEDMETHLIRMAKHPKRPNVTAALAYLNAHHADYGQIRTQVLQRILGPFLDRICKLAQQYVPPGLLNEFIEQLGADAQRVALESAGGKR